MPRGFIYNSMFIGEYQHTLDDKGRVAVPAKFRSELKNGLVVTQGLDKCLVAYTAEEWGKVALKLAAMPVVKSDSRAFARFMLAKAMDMELDGQGRVMLPDYLRRYANLKKEVVITGLYTRLEIWDKGSWEKYSANVSKNSAEVAEKLGELGI